MMNYFVSIIAIIALFVNVKKPAWSFFIWIGTNLYWTCYAYRVHDIPQIIMFAAFTISCVIIWWKIA